MSTGRSRDALQEGSGMVRGRSQVRRRVTGYGIELAALIQRGAGRGGLHGEKWRREKVGRLQENWPNQ
jgi:hypothetical protein